MSDDSLSSPTTIKVRVVNKNAKISVDQAVTLENMLSVHNLLTSSHPYLLNKIGVLEQISQNLNLKDQEIASSFENAIDFHDKLSTSHPSILSNLALIKQSIESLGSKDNELEIHINQNLALKANTGLSNISPSAAHGLDSVGIRTVVENYQNGTAFYRVWSDGFIEQWGRVLNLASQEARSINFLKPYSNTNYYVEATRQANNSTGSYTVSAFPSASSSFALWGNNHVACNVSWYACGY